MGCRYYGRTHQLIADGAIFAASFAAAYLIRFEGLPPWFASKQLFLWLPYLLTARLLVNWKLGIYRFIWRYVSLSDALAIARSLTVVTSVLLVLRFFYPSEIIFAQRVRIPLGIIALEFLLSLTGSLGARSLRRLLYERGRKRTASLVQDVKRVILYGAGRAGILLLRELQNHGEVQVVGFVDDDPRKVGTAISGHKVLGDGGALDELVHQLRIDEVVISIATASRKALTQILARCERIPVPAKIVPSLQEIVEGHVSISQVREIRIEELLGRETVEATEFDEEVWRGYAGKRILVTGAGGSIGNELVRQLLLFEPESIAALDKDENAIYEIEQELNFKFPFARIEPLVADIRHRGRLNAVFAEFKPQVVFHAAAHKHVPLMEKHACEAVLNNVHGTTTLLDVCCDHSVERFVFISTDKAVNPTSVMGATKRVGELLVQTFASERSLPSACVRFGNVMGSRGSVVPLFKKQIAEGRPITLTHPDVVRFFMTVPEAVQLVLCAGILAQQGEIFVLDMGNPLKIMDLAREMATLAGLEPGKDIEIVITGLRPGEKLREELVRPSEKLSRTRFEKLSVIQPEPQNEREVFESVAELVRAAQENDSRKVYEVLFGTGAGFRAGVESALNPPRQIEIEWTKHSR
jgi:FlaA1/EpsC-like NDP-sugar epimerase